MHLDFKEILAAYKARKNPTEFQTMLAEARLAICEVCPKIKTGIGNIKYCSVCGCVIGGKIFSPKEGACPEGKWNKLDSEKMNCRAVEVLKNKKASLI